MRDAHTHTLVLYTRIRTVSERTVWCVDSLNKLPSFRGIISAASARDYYARGDGRWPGFRLAVVRDDLRIARNCFGALVGYIFPR